MRTINLFGAVRLMGLFARGAEGGIHFISFSLASVSIMLSTVLSYHFVLVPDNRNLVSPVVRLL